MNLEDVEQRCLNYLKQSKNPLVPLEQLLKHCKQDENCAGINEVILSDFLRKHDEVRVVEGPTADAPVSVDVFAAAGLVMGTRFIYRDRVPTQAELAVLIKEHIDAMIVSLEGALGRPELAGDPQRKAQLEQALERARALQGKVQQML
jgi:hypothetical protein